jgi:hypothetical protein
LKTYQSRQADPSNTHSCAALIIALLQGSVAAALVFSAAENAREELNTVT